ncbi:MAG: helix-turn-helix domain-containing protein [Candidatus Bipolaricaulota bacterium]
MYTVQQLAEILALHPKTVQRFLREGRIKATKIGREWRVHGDDLRDFAHGELSTPEPTESVATTRLAERIQVTAVIELDEGNSSEVSRISNSLIAVLNSKDPRFGAVRYDLVYHPEVRKARFVVHGTPLFLRTLLQLVDVLLEQDEG